jgi:hypothetical protein
MVADPTPWLSWPSGAPAPTATPADYRAFVQFVQIVRVRFAKAAVYAPAIFIPDPARRLVASTTRDARYLNFSQGFAATLIFQFRGRWQDDPASGVTADAEVEVLYRSPVLMTDEMFRWFKDAHLPGHAWPYLREFLHSELARTGWPVHTLPVFAPARGNADPTASPSDGLDE